MVVACEEVWRQVSNYVDGEVDPGLRTAIDEHIRGCRRCAAVLDGTRNLIQLYGDERMLEVPLGFRHRLHRRLDQSMRPSLSNRRGFLGWMVATAAACLVVGTIEVARSLPFRGPQLRSQQAQLGNGVPPDLLVVVADDGKLFHLAACPFIHEKDKRRTITAAEASREGYTPCVRCLKKYLPVTVGEWTTGAETTAAFREPPLR